MARAPVAAADPALADDPEMMAPDAGGAEEGTEPTSTVVVTICKTPEGGYMVYAGDEQEADEGQPADGMEEGSPNAGQPADGIGAALHAAMVILQDDAQGADGQGGAQAEFEKGFGGEGGPA